MKTTLDFREIGRNPDPKIIGVSNGAGQTVFDEDFLNRHSHFKNIFYNEAKNTDNNWWEKWVLWKMYGEVLHKIKLDKLAKHTDYINSIGLFRGMFVSNRFREILETSNLPDHHFFEITFIQKEKMIDGYWWFCFDYETGENTVDFSKCEYNLRDHKRNFGEDFSVNIKTYSDYMDIFYKTGKAITTTELTFNSNFDANLDIFGMQFLTNSVYISNRLNQKLQKQNIVGYKATYPIFELVFPAGTDL